MKSEPEYDRRIRAIKLLGKGVRFEEVLRQVQRRRFWLSKWTRRYKAFGLEGLRDRSRVPEHIRNRTRETLVQRILDLLMLIRRILGTSTSGSTIGLMESYT
jgi:transposase